MAPPAVYALDGVIRHYGWGSRTTIPEMLGIEADGRPAAELWFGAHPDDPCDLPRHDMSLADLIADDPDDVLGRPVVAAFGPRLPYLLKLLAAQTPLSMQVHPSIAQAQAGFAAEDAAGISRAAAARTYHDDNHKPELLYALTSFEALCGFRPVDRTIALLEEIALPELDSLIALLRGPDPLRAAFTALLRADDPRALADAVARRAAGAQDGPLRAARLAAESFPGDVGVVLTLLLNYVPLQPGDAIYLAAGNVHAYLSGTGVEIMANSDNVLRCGLTGKHVDVDELLKVADFSVLTEPRWPSVGGTFEVAVPDFRLTHLEVDEPTGLDDPGPTIVLCINGTAHVGDVELHRGHAAFVLADRATTIAGSGPDGSAGSAEVFIAGVGRA